MSKSIQEKHFDVRVMNRYMQKGVISKQDIEAHYTNLPNDENNFDLVMIEDDEIGMGDELSEEEISSMPEMTEDSIDNFDFMGNQEDQDKPQE